MIRIRMREPRIARWRDWKKRCEAQMKPFIKPPKRPPAIDADLYKECKDLILAAYADKCAYCEGPIGAQTLGDVEHFRPKSAVRDQDNKVVYAAKGQPHQGYWWLAYSHTNLLPSCNMCNRYTKVAGGKGERFPVAGYRATKPGEERRERPLLIHPARTDPSRHFVLELETGFLRGLTESGRVCICVLGLNRDILVRERKLAIQTATMYLSQGKLVARTPDFRARLEESLKGLLPYSFAWRSVKKTISKARARRPRRK